MWSYLGDLPHHLLLLRSSVPLPRLPQEKHRPEVVPGQRCVEVEVGVEDELGHLEQALVLGDSDHHVNMVVLSSLHQLRGNVGQEVSVHDPGSSENLLDAHGLLRAPVNGLLDGLPVQTLQTVELAVRREVSAVEHGGHEGGETHGVLLCPPLPVRVEQSAALHDHPLEQALGVRGEVEVGAGPAAGGLAVDGHEVGVPAELFDVSVDPLEGGHQVEQPLVARGLGDTERGESQGAQPVVGSHDDDVPLYPGVGPVRPPAQNSITTTATLISLYYSHHSLPPLLKYPPKIQNMTGSLSPGTALMGV